MNEWCESVAEARRRARKRLPASVYGALIAGSERGWTVDDNIPAFAELGFAPHVGGPADTTTRASAERGFAPPVAGHHPERELSPPVLAQPVSLPVIIS